VVKRGFTLVELLTTVAIMSIVMAVMAQSFLGSWNAQLSQEIMSELQRSARLTLDEMTKQTWNATTVVSSISSGGTSYTSTANSVALRLPPMDANNTIITGDDHLVFRQDNRRIERRVIPGSGSIRAGWKTPLTLNDDTGTLTIKYYNSAGLELVPGNDDLSSARKLALTIRTTRTHGGRTYERELAATIMLRNKGL